MQKIIVTTLYLLTIFIPLTFTTINHELFEFPKFILLLSGTVVIVVAWLIDYFQNKNKPQLVIDHWSLVTYTIVAILIIQALATIVSIHPYTSFWGYYTRFHGGLLTTMCYTIIYFAALKWLDTKSTQKIIKISINTAFFISLYGILQHFGIDKSFWVQDVQNRIFSTLGQPNWLAAYLLPNIFFVLYLAQTSKIKRLTLYSLLFTLLVALLYTKSRSGFLAFGLSYLTYWLLMIRQFSFAKIKSGFITYSLLLTLTLALIGTPYSPSISSFIIHQPSTINTAPLGTVLENGGTESGDIRKIVWTGALDLVKKHPILGTGPETFAYTYYIARPTEHNLTSEWDFLYNKAHNEYLNTAATTGVLGLLAYLAWHYALLQLSFTRIPKSKKVNEEKLDYARALAPVVGASVVGFTVTNFFGFSVIPVYLLIVTISVLPKTIAQEPTKSPYPIPHTTYPILCVALIYPALLFYADYLFARGKAALDKSQVSQAIQYLQKAAALRPGLDLYQSYLGEAYSSLASSAAGSDDEAIKAQSAKFEELAVKQAELTKDLNPHHLNYYKSRAKIYLTLAVIKSQYNLQAGEELQAARLLAPSDPKLAYNLGLVYTRINKLTDAEQQLKDAISLKPNYPDPYYALTLLYEQTNQAAKIPDLLTNAKSNLATYSAQLKTKIDQYSPKN